MKFTVSIAFAALAALAVAQLNAVPQCALNCLINGIGPTGCALTDFKCSCSNQAFVDSSATCIEGACSAEDVEKAKAATLKLCKDAGVDIVFPGKPTTTNPPPTTTAPPPPSSTPEPPITTPGSPVTTPKPPTTSCTSKPVIPPPPPPPPTKICTCGGVKPIPTPKLNPKCLRACVCKECCSYRGSPYRRDLESFDLE